jgi:hypothetical protein
MSTYPRVSISDLRRMIPVIGTTITPLILSEPGCGKTSLLNLIMQDIGSGYDGIYVDGGSLNYGDIGSYIPVHETKTLEFYVAKLFNLSDPRPKVIMIDEFTKVPKVLRPTITRLILERCVGDIKLPDGSIVIANGNLSSDGVGDFLAAHEGNRVAVFEMEKPRALDDAGNPSDWLIWAAENGVSSITRTFAAMTPTAFASYRDDKNNTNPMIFNPRTNNVTFLSLRSLTKADKAFVQNRHILGEKILFAGLAGTIGEAAARALMNYIAIGSNLISTADVVKDPDGVKVPTNIGALYMMIFNAVEQLATQDQLTAFMKFVSRTGSNEIEAVFFSMLAANAKTARMARGNPTINKWLLDNHQIV